ncbi:MAG: DUF2911 domain-containing protein [Rhizobacter sp.]|nr:DUF2911 domain-containing protein [Chlorobiales bacterium]
MKRLTILSVLMLLAVVAHAQLTMPPDGGNKKASVSERIGITDVVVTYDRPAVKGREGKIWGGLVPYGFNDLGFGTSKQAPWRAGANENTTVSFSTDVKIEGKPLAAGKYGFFIALQEDGTATVIFSKNASSWGSFFYDATEDALRATVKTEKMSQSIERLKYEFLDQTENTATVALLWEKLKIPFRIEVELPKTQVESFRRELRSDKGFKWEAFAEAAAFCVRNNTNLPEALMWADAAVSRPFVGEKNFRTLSVKSQVLTASGKTTEADAVMAEALPMGSMQELHQYARQLLAGKKPAEALKVFKLNAEKNPNQFTTAMGLMRGYAAAGDIKNALQHAKAALPLAPDAGNKASVENMIKQLEAGKTIN